jgi:hypothetical protein
MQTGKGIANGREGNEGRRLRREKDCRGRGIIMGRTKAKNKRNKVHILSLLFPLRARRDECLPKFLGASVFL